MPRVLQPCIAVLLRLGVDSFITLSRNAAAGKGIGRELYQGQCGGFVMISAMGNCFTVTSLFDTTL